jgi:hypothetical protein
MLGKLIVYMKPPPTSSVVTLSTTCFNLGNAESACPAVVEGLSRYIPRGVPVDFALNWLRQIVVSLRQI